jgi:hypothetical protein
VLPSDLLTRFMVILMVTAVSSTMVPQLPIFQVYASNSAYDSGYDHGCDDAGISNPSDRYINQPEKGPSFHTGEFMQGYNAGFNSCSGGAGFQESRPFSSDDRNGNSNENVKSEGNGAEDGTNEARSDFLNTNGRGKDPSCSPYEHTDAYCTAFKLAYEVQWGYDFRKIGRLIKPNMENFNSVG